LVSSIAIDAIKEEGYGYRLSSVNVLVDDVLCGQLPEDTQDNVVYTITCATPLSGTQIKLETTRDDHYLSLNGITVNVRQELRSTLEA
jgi:hypothetical protein